MFFTARFPRTKNFMAAFCLNDFYDVKLEVDMAASHNVLSANMFEDLVKKSDVNPPVLVNSGSILKLADGTPSDKLKGVGYLSVKLIHSDSVVFARSAYVPVFVVDGPNCLLGRPAMQILMPEVYSILTDLVDASLETTRGRNLVNHSAGVAAVTATVASSDTTTALTATPAAAVNLKGKKVCAVSKDVHVSGAGEHAGDHDVTAADAPAAATQPTVTRPHTQKRTLPPPPSGDITQVEGEIL